MFVQPPAPPVEPLAAPLLSEEEAKAAWLAQLDAPSWGKAAMAMAEAAADAAEAAFLAEACDEGEAVACDALSLEEETKRGWLSELDAPTWGVAAKAVIAVAKDVVEERAMTAEEIAKRAWLPRLDDPPPLGAGVSLAAMEEEKARAAWLAKLDAPSWGQAAEAMATVAAEAAAVSDLTERCDGGEAEACDLLSSEDEAKRAWLSKLDAPTWGATAAAVSAV
eukprot:560258-Prymnesium_polylepis.1